MRLLGDGSGCLHKPASLVCPLTGTSPTSRPYPSLTHPSRRLDQFLPQDFSIANHYIENHPTSFFRQHRLACRLTDEGKVTLLDDCFRVMRDGEAAPVEERRLEGEGELREVLAQHFGVELP